MREAPIRVIVQHRFTLIRDAIATALRLVAGIDVVGTVSSLVEVATMSRGDAPDVIVLDLGEDRTAGFEAVAQLSAMSADTRIVGVVDHIDAAEVAEAERVGIQHLVSMAVGFDALLQAIREEQALSVRHFVHVHGEAEGRRAQSLTQRENAVLERVAAGDSRATIAETLMISPKTVDNHKRSIVVKLGAANQAHAVSIAFKRGLLPRGSERGSGHP